MKKLKVFLLATVLLASAAAAPSAFALGQLRSMGPLNGDIRTDVAVAAALVGPGL